MPSAKWLQQESRTPAASVRLGVCQYLLGRYSNAVQTLTNADGGALTHFYLGKALLALDKYERPSLRYESAERAGYNRDDVALAKAEALRYRGKAQDALLILDDLSGAVEQTAEYLYQRSATVSALGGNPNEVVALLERAVESDNTHSGALFGLALENDRHGNDDYARQLYERAAAQFPDPCRHAAQSGTALRRHRALRAFQAMLPTHPGCLSRSSAGTALFQGCRRLARSCTTTRKHAAARIAWPRSSACR